MLMPQIKIKDCGECCSQPKSPSCPQVSAHFTGSVAPHQPFPRADRACPVMET